MTNRPFTRIDGIGIPTHVIPQRYADQFLQADPDAVTCTQNDRLLVFRTTIDPSELTFYGKVAEGTDWERVELFSLEDFAVLYRPTDHEIVEALRGPAGPVGPQGVTAPVEKVNTDA